jgi:hypothetical protein
MLTKIDGLKPLCLSIYLVIFRELTHLDEWLGLISSVITIVSAALAGYSYYLKIKRQIKDAKAKKVPRNPLY